MVVGFLGGGYITRYLGFFSTFVATQCLSAASVMAALASRETLARAKRRSTISWREANLFAVLGLVARKRGAAILAAIFSVQVACKLGLVSVTILYVRHMYAWQPDRINMYLAADALSKASALYVVLPLVQRFARAGSLLRKDSVLISVRAGGGGKARTEMTLAALYLSPRPLPSSLH